MSAYTITWETYRAMQDRIIALEKRCTELAQEAAEKVIFSETMLLEAEREIDKLDKQLKKLGA